MVFLAHKFPDYLSTQVGLLIKVHMSLVRPGLGCIKVVNLFVRIERKRKVVKTARQLTELITVNELVQLSKGLLLPINSVKPMLPPASHSHSHPGD